jgi:hypothetical protein
MSREVRVCNFTLIKIVFDWVGVLTNFCINSHKESWKCCEILLIRVLMVRLGVEYEYYSNTLCELRGLTLWDKI